MNQEQLRNFFSHGSPDPLPTRTLLRAGPLSMFFEAGDLRYIKLGDREVIRRIYAAVRDRNWGTVPGQISNLEVKSAPDSFEISYQCEHRQNEIHFLWDAKITGNPDGSIRFLFDGEAKSDFLRNRIGFCVLHPIQSAGAKCRAIYADGSKKDTELPRTIAAEQPVTSLHDLAGLDHEVEPGVWSELRFEGDLFETEDQRNWIDASFKTFCTPLRLPFPVEIKAGTRIHQKIHFRLANSGRSNVSVSTQRRPIEVTCRSETSKLPAIGLGWARVIGGLREIEVRRLAALNLAHLRVDLRPFEIETVVDLQMACTIAAELKINIELAIPFHSGPYQTPGIYLDFVGQQLHLDVNCTARILVFGGRNDDSTSSAALEAARSAFRHLRAPVAAGTNADLYQLNLQRPPPDADAICWSMNPQVHAFDCTSIAETPEAAAEQVESMRTYFPGKDLVVSPITLKPRFNPVATGTQDVTAVDELPPDVDPRQLSLFGAGWTVAMIKALSESGAASATFYETIGWRGVMESGTGSTCPEKFPSIPGTVFPLYHVLADVGEFAGGEIVRTQASDPLTIASLLLRTESRHRLLLANLSEQSQNVSLVNFAPTGRAKGLKVTNSHAAMNFPENFRQSTYAFSGPGLSLEPHEIATVDFDS